MKTSGQVAKLMGITSRTLQHYDDIGLLCPARTDEGVSNNRKLYSDEDIERLRQILIYRDLGFRLNEIAQILDSEPAQVEEISNARIRDLWVQKDRVHNLAATVSLSKIVNLDRFAERTYETGGLDAYYCNRMPSHGFMEAMRHVENMTEEDIQSADKAFADVAGRFASMGDTLTYHEMEEAGEALWEWYEDHWFLLPDGGFFILWGLFQEDCPLAKEAAALGGPEMVDRIRFYLHTLWVQDAMLSLYPVLEEFDSFHDDDASLAGSYEGQHLHLQLIEGICDSSGMDNPFVSVPDDWDCDDFIAIGDHLLAMVFTIAGDIEMMEFLGLDGLIEISEAATTRARAGLQLLFKDTVESE